MDFFTPDDNIERVPPAEMRFIGLKTEPDPSQKRIKVFLEITPFQRSPYIDLVVNDSQGNVVTSTSIIEPAAWKIDLVMHARQMGFSPGEYSLHAVLYHPEFGEIDYKKVSFSMPEFQK